MKLSVCVFLNILLKTVILNYSTIWLLTPTSCDYIRVCNKHNEIFINHLLSHFTHKFMHDYIVKSSIARKLVQKATLIDTFTSNNTKARIHKIY